MSFLVPSRFCRRLPSWGGLVILAAFPLLAPAQLAIRTDVPVGFPITAFTDLEPEDIIQGGFAVPTADEEIADALKDFQRQVKNRAWEKAFDVMGKLAEAPEDQMLRREDGLILPARQVARDALVSLPPEGRDAYRLFFDARASRILETSNPAQGASPEDEMAAARTVYERFFLSSVGDNAANLLGDAYFQQGEFLKAEHCWRSILEHHPDTELSEPRLHAKRALALQRAGAREGLQAVAALILERHADERVRLGGREVRLGSWIGGLSLGDERPAETTASAPSLISGHAPGLERLSKAGALEPEWQFVMIPDFMAESIDAALGNNYYRRTSPDTLVPPVALHGGRLFVNWFGIGCAVDVKTGKLLWRADKFLEMKSRFTQMYRLDLNRFSVAANSNAVAMVMMDPKRLNYHREPFRLVAFHPETGKELWTTQKIGKLNALSFASDPVLYRDEILAVAHGRQDSKAALYALGAKDGKEHWKLELGSAQGGHDSMTGSQTVPSATLRREGHTLYYLANNGALLAIDLRRRELGWATKFAPPEGTGVNRNYYYNNQPVELHALLHVPGRMEIAGPTLLYKEARGSRFYGLDIEGRKVLWRRPTDPNAAFVGVDERHFYLLSDELLAYDRKTLALRWATSIPVAAGPVQCLVGESSILAFTKRGIYELSKEDGDTLRILRGHDRDSGGGALGIAEGRLLTISNRSITAYSLDPDS